MSLKGITGNDDDDDFIPLHVLSTCAHRLEAKIVLYSLWYHHTYRWPSGAEVERGVMIPETV